MKERPWKHCRFIGCKLWTICIDTKHAPPIVLLAITSNPWISFFKVLIEKCVEHNLAPRLKDQGSVLFNSVQGM